MSSGLAKTILQGTVKGKRKRGRQKKRWEDNIKGGQEWTLPAQLGQLKTGQDGKGLLQIHLWCPDDLPRLWDRKEKKFGGVGPVFVFSRTGVAAPFRIV